MTAKVFGIRISFTYAFLMLGSGVQLPFLPLWLSAKGIAVENIAMIVAGAMATRILGAPLFAWIADHFGNRRLVIQLCAAFSLMAYGLLAISNGFTPIMTMVLIASFMFAPVFPLTEGFSVDGSQAHGLDYGRLRLWASVSFLAGSLGAGALLTVLKPEDTAWLLAGAQAVAFLATLLLPHEPDSEKTEASGDVLENARHLFFGSSFPLLMVAAGLGQASHGFMNSFGSVHFSHLGVDTFGIGVLWASAVTSEVLLLGFSGRLVASFGPGRLLLLGISGGLVRWILMGFVSSYSIMLATQTLHALSFATLHLGTMHCIRLMVPNSMRNRAQGIYSALSGGVLISSTAYMSGRLYGTFGQSSYFFMAGLSLLSLVATLALIRFSPRVRSVAAA
jgi:MFS transporter, PPP family, 3-phenylpropionic acid transporter